jgi:hypothetical protein
MQPRASDAQWSKLPNGELSYHTDYTSYMAFHCANFADEWVDVTCSPLAGGNGIVIWNNGASMTLSVTPTSGFLDATNVSKRVFLGAIQQTVGGNGNFIFPAGAHPRSPMITFSVGIMTSTPFPWGAGMYKGYNVPAPATSIAPNCCDGWSSVGTLPITAPPAGFTYSSIAIDRFTRPVLLAQDNTIIVEASYGLIPEPSTVVLLGSGLVGVAGVLARRRRRAA